MEVIINNKKRKLMKDAKTKDHQMSAITNTATTSRHRSDLDRVHQKTRFFNRPTLSSVRLPSDCNAPDKIRKYRKDCRSKHLTSS